MKFLLTFILSLTFLSAFSQTASYQYLDVQRRFTLAGRSVKGISNDTVMLIASADSLVTQYAVKGYINNNFGPGTSNAYNFNPEQFIVSGYDVSIRFPQDPGEPLFTGSPAFNFTQQHLDFLDSLMLAVGQDTYLDDRDFYYSPDPLNPIRWKAFTLTTTGTGAATWDSTNKNLNIPVSLGGSSGGSSSPYHLPYNGDSSSYLGGDSALHQLPPTPPPGDSIDYSFTSMTTIYNEAGPGEYTITSNGVTTNKDNFNFPFRQLKSLDIGGWSNGDYVSFANTGSANSTTYTFLRGFVRLKQAVPVIQNLSFQFYKNGSPISALVSMVNYGLDKSKANSYQNITIPISAFQFTSNDFDELRLKFGGGSSPDGLYLDLFQFQNATVNENTYVTDLFKKAGTDSVFKVLGGQNVFAFIDSTGGFDSTSLSNRINLKLNIADTLNKWAAKNHIHAESDVTNLFSDLAGKEPTIAAGTTSQYWRGDKTWQTLNTDAVAEATNKYYTDTRARAAITLTTTGTSGAATYNSGTGIINIPNYTFTTPTLQQVTTAGNITTLGIRAQQFAVTNPANPTSANLGSLQSVFYGDGVYGGVMSLKSNTTNNFYVDVQPTTLTAPRSILLPDKDGTIALLSDITSGGSSGVSSFNSRTGAVLPDILDYASYYAAISHTHTASQITDFMSAARSAISVTGTGGSYDNTTGIITLTGGGGSSGWSLSGNSISPSNFLGTTSNNSLRFRTNNIERMFLDSMGVLSFGNTSVSRTYIYFQDAGAGTRYGLALNTTAFQFFMPNTGSFTWNKGGDQQAPNTNLLMTLNNNGDLAVPSSISTPRISSNLALTGGTPFTANAKLSFGTGFGSAAIHYYDGGAGVRYGTSINSTELQTFFPSNGHYSFNKGGDHNASGTNELMRIDAATGSLVIGTTAATASSLLTVTSTTKGVLFPRMTTTQRDAISSPAEGLTIYNLTTHQNETWNGTSWAH